MKTKPIILILTLLFCLSGSVVAEDMVDNIKYKPHKNRIDRYRKIIDFDKLKKEKRSTIKAEDLNGVIKKVESLPTKIIDTAKIWAYEDLENIKTQSVLENEFENNKTLSFKPLKRLGKLIYMEHYKRDDHHATPLNKRIKKDYSIMYYYNPDSLKIKKLYFGYFPMGFCIVQYKSKVNGVNVLNTKKFYDYGIPISFEEYKNGFKNLQTNDN